jgi:hypothetical protein
VCAGFRGATRVSSSEEGFFMVNMTQTNGRSTSVDVVFDHLYGKFLKLKSPRNLVFLGNLFAMPSVTFRILIYC